MKDFLRFLLKNERGSVIVPVAVGLTFMMGFTALVVDFGGLALERRNLVNAADAATLAGAYELIEDSSATSQAEAKALEYAQQNGVEPESVNVNVCGSGREISVEISSDVPYTFARVLGFEQGTTAASARAVIGPLTAKGGAAPLAVSDEMMKDINKGEELELKVSSDTKFQFGPGNFGALALGSKGANQYGENLKYGYSENLSIGDTVDTQPGNISGHTKKGIEHRINECSSSCSNNGNCTIDSHDQDCPLILHIPVIKDPGGEGSQEVEIVGFAAFLVDAENPPGPGKESSIMGSFIEHVDIGQTGESGDIEDFGVLAVNLVE